MKGSDWWVMRMAWRDSRRSRPRLFLFLSSVIIGIAALVAIRSFSLNLRTDMDMQAAALLGADLQVDSRREPGKEALQLVDSLRGLSTGYSEERSFMSMIRFPAGKGTRLVQIRALSGDFPFYGRISTTPADAASGFRQHKEALLDKALLLQFDARVGDEVQIGKETFRIAGALDRVPGRTGLMGAMAPTVFIPLQFLEQTGLQQKGSRISYNYYFRFAEEALADRLTEQLDERLGLMALDYETVATRKEGMGRTFSDLTGFLALTGFIALLLGCIGVSGAVQVYVREKIGSIAVLRCLGASARQAFLIFLIQVAAAGLLGSVLGAILGMFIQQLLPLVLAGFLPVQVSTAVSFSAVAEGIGLGLFISVFFALLPLSGIISVSPLQALRRAFDNGQKTGARIKGILYAGILLLILLFARWQLGNWQEAVVFTGAVTAGFAVLYLTALALMKLTRRYMPAGWKYTWRQGLSNLYRPNNQTAILIVAIGLGTAFIATLLVAQHMLLQRVTLTASGNQPNMVIFDIQSAQKDSVAAVVRQQGLPVIQQVPIVTVQLTAVNGYTAADVQKDSSVNIPSRAFRGELRVTYRDTLTASEQLVAGEWMGSTQPGDTARISLEEGYARRIGVKIGDRLQFNVQGVMIPAIVGSFREVDWNRIQTNFRVVFPMGVIDAAPRFHVLITRTPDETVSADFQRQVVSRFPNVSVIDLGLILDVLDEILNKAGWVIRFMSALSLLTGLVVLIASIMISKYRRIQENALLRTLGASGKQLLAINTLEYVFLGAFAALTGIVLSLVAGWLLAAFYFETRFTPPVLSLLWLLVGTTVLTVVVGLLNSRRILNRPPMEILNSD